MGKFLDTDQVKLDRAKKNMLWFGIISLSMSFAGLTSAYVVSKERPDWLTDFVIPPAFYISLVLILFSSATIILAKNFVRRQKHQIGLLLLITTFILGVKGFAEIIKDGYNFTGPTSTITTSFVYVIVLLHVAHVFAGLISLLFVIYNQYKLKYDNGKTLGIELAATFWHFIDLVWIYLFLFLYFVR